MLYRTYLFLECHQSHECHQSWLSNLCVIIPIKLIHRVFTTGTLLPQFFFVNFIVNAKLHDVKIWCNYRNFKIFWSFINELRILWKCIFSNFILNRWIWWFWIKGSLVCVSWLLVKNARHYIFIRIKWMRFQLSYMTDMIFKITKINENLDKNLRFWKIYKKCLS